MGHNGGRAQVNVSQALNTFCMPFIDACKSCGGQGFEPSDLTSNWATKYDPRGYPISLPNSGNFAAFPQIYGQPGDVWVLTWPGTAVLTLTSVNLGAPTATSNRVECTVTSSSTAFNADGTPTQTFQAIITITSITGTNPFAGGSIRLFLKDGSPSCLGTGYETRLANGEVFDPRFVARAGRFGVIRLSNWMIESAGNPNPGVGKWADRRPSDAFSYYSNDLLSANFCGASTGTNAQVVSQPPTPIASWTQGQTVQWQIGASNAPVFVVPSAVTNANPAVFTATAHGLVNGDQIQFPPNGSNGDGLWGNLTMTSDFAQFKFWTVTKIDNDHFSVAFDSTSAGTYPTSAGIKLPYAKVITLKVGSLAAVPCINQAYSTNFSTTGWPLFVLGILNAGDIVTGIYDATLGVLVCGNNATGSLLFRGVPIEIIVEKLCNLNGNHPYLHLPPLADDDYHTQAATYLKNNLASGLIPRHELQNEVWNNAYGMIGYWFAVSFALFATNSMHHGLGKRIAEIADLWKSAYGGRGGFKIMMPVQSGSSTFYQFNSFVQQRMIDPLYAGKTVTITIANPAVFTTTGAHGYVADDLVLLTTTVALPAPLLDGVNASSATPYFVLASGLTSTQFQLATTKGGAAISTVGGSQSGTQTVIHPPVAKCDAIVHAPYFDTAFTQGTTSSNYPNSKAAGGWADQVWNYHSGDTATAFNWVHDEFINASQDPGTFPTSTPISVNRDTIIPFWKSIANIFGCELHEYEGDKSIFSSEGGFPTTDTRGNTVTVAMIEAFWLDFLNSSQAADLTRMAKQVSADLGTLFPSTYYLDGPQLAPNAYWPSFRLNTTGNGFVDSTATAAYTALRAWNDLFVPGHKNIKGGF